MVSDKDEVKAACEYIHTYIHIYIHTYVHTRTHRLQKDMVSDKDEVKAAAEIGLKELVAMAMGEAIKTHHT